MELFINLLFIVLIVAMVILLIKSPKEISSNLIGGFIIGLIRRMFFPLAWIYDLWKNYRKDKKREASVRELINSQNPDWSIPFPVEEATFYILIKGKYPIEAFEDDIKDYLKLLDPPFPSLTFSHSPDFSIIRFSYVEALNDAYIITQELTEGYGMINTQGYLESNDWQFSFSVDLVEPFYMTGILQDGRSCYYHPRDFGFDSNDLVFQDHQHHWPPVDIFKHMIQNSPEFSTK